MPEYPDILKGPSIEDLNGELDHFWKDLHTNADLKDHIKAKGIDVGKSPVANEATASLLDHPPRSSTQEKGLTS
jgi:hypothetical protein